MKLSINDYVQCGSIEKDFNALKAPIESVRLTEYRPPYAY